MQLNGLWRRGPRTTATRPNKESFAIFIVFFFSQVASAMEVGEPADPCSWQRGNERHGYKDITVHSHPPLRGGEG
ncbi:hypothetical protein BC940DRAFT_291123 [Gongronella butleri]|nr:hypothetical protein BC940DRAFT_291123 [Gongronella butleri]